jgi:hypothetical protein
MIERQIEAPVLPGDDEAQFPLADEIQPDPLGHSGEEIYVEPGGLVELAVNELGGEVTAVELLPDEEP